MRTTIFTSITANYLPKARVLAQSVKKHNPNIVFALLLAETAPLDFSADFSDFDKVVLLNDLAIPDLPSWLFKHSVVEACTAIKGFYLQQLLEEDSCDAVLYLDPDMAVFSSLESVISAFDTASVLLTPHLLDKEENDADIITNELSALKHGVYNLGFVGVKNSSEGKRFAAWWKERLAKFCYADIPNGMFTDQRWVDLAPAFFPDLHILRHPGCNVATWNLNQRMVEGTLESGFTVNGEPLIFYHFSGFDGGSQLGMLNRYASSMPAAFILREWYINACAERETEPLSGLWQYNYYTDGGAITQKEREFYRENPLISAQFPDPFQAGKRGFADWYQFYSADYQQSSIPDFGNNPLAHFLNNGWRQGVSPHPAFDSRFYLESYPDVHKAQFNPLLHYKQTGTKEKRNPHPFFDTGFIMRRYGEYIKNSGLTPLEYMLSHKEHAISLHYYDKVEDAGRVQQLEQGLQKELPTILLINHNQGGGTEKHVYDLPKIFKGKANFLLLYPLTEHAIRLANFGGEYAADIVFDSSTQQEELVSLLQQLGVSRLHIHHLMGNESYIQSFIDALKLPYDVTLHDYYLLSPQPHLTDENDRFAGEPIGYSMWQQEHFWLLEGASRVIAPSRDITERHRNFFPDTIRYRVASHPSLFTFDSKVVNPAPLNKGERLRVVVLGLLSPNKGSAVLEKTALLAYEMMEEVDFHLIGYTLTPLTVSPEGNLTIHGAYAEEELPQLLTSLKPHVVWFPALCPESFSYTLSSTMAACLPVVVPDIGAFPERVANRPWSWVKNWDSRAGEWLKFFAAIREQHFVTGIAPKLPEEKAHRVEEQFYEEDYVVTSLPIMQNHKSDQ